MLSIDPKPKAVWSCTFSGYRNGPLGEPRGRCGKAAGGCLAGTSFRGTFPDAGETFCRELTKSRKLSGAALFLAIAAGYLGSLAVGGKRQREADGRKHFSGVYLRRLAELFAGDRPKAEGSLEPHFFELSQRAAWEASRSVWKGSRKLSDLNIFSGYISEGWKGFLLRIDPKPKAV